MKKRRLYGITCFLAGVFAATVMMICIDTIPEVSADNRMNCVRTDLNAWGYAGDINSSQFDIGYEIPSCIKSAGYQVAKVRMRNGMVRITYKGPGRSGLQGGDGSIKSF